MAGALTGGSPAALGLKQSSRLLKRLMRLTGRLMSAVVTSSRQLRRTKAMQGSTSHSKRVWTCGIDITVMRGHRLLLQFAMQPLKEGMDL